ncbi:LysR family transcriptional regulator [Parasphingorhabdus halotolerans]|uniref:LysR family transcriptional regulator n=2 Tax=Parasphingorhabdus halotolerans TaxID=2725558 RepID=A0A6H2DKU0_9SPHN|nr:LysR family transcriptional regulator [Parasphingorhabdus halotolerans]
MILNRIIIGQTLNSLPILREILRHGSVGKAATALGVSQPALSAALKQLRLHFDDELVIRSKGSMKLTPRAESILSPLEDALSTLHDIIAPIEESPLRQQTVLKIATNDHIMATLGGPLSKLLMGEDLDILPQFLSAGGHSAQQLVSGEIDYVIAPKFVILSSGVNVSALKLINSELLFSEDLIGVGHKDEGALLRNLSEEDYLNYPHASFEIDADKNISMEQAFLVANNFVQNDIIRFSSYAALPSAITQTHCIALVPRSFAKMLEALITIEVFKPPIEFPPIEWTLIWHRRNDDIDRHVQFRTILKSCSLHVAGSINRSDDSRA